MLNPPKLISGYLGTYLVSITLRSAVLQGLRFLLNHCFPLFHHLGTFFTICLAPCLSPVLVATAAGTPPTPVVAVPATPAIIDGTQVAASSPYSHGSAFPSPSISM